MRSGMSAQQACEAVIERIIDINGGLDNTHFNVKMVAISKNGDVGCASVLGSKEGPPTACYIDESGFQVVNGKYYKNW